ncbi:MAG: hypothetical protein OEY52_02040 [Gammaproteobacteria bacterium]|nr:hypothetical protein [Gammaproteobacteria bacterium]
MNKKFLSKAVWLGLASTTLIACSNSSGGGGSSSSDKAVALPFAMSLVTANSTGDSASLLNNHVFGAVTSTTFDSGSNYATDKTNTYVYDESMESLSTANMILCLMSQTGADQMLNQGAYYALVDEDKCEQGSNNSGAGSTGQSSGAKATEYNRWTIQASRASDTSPMIVKAWIPGDDASAAKRPEDQESVLVEVTATSGVSDADPFGNFSIRFRGVTEYSGYGGSAGNYVDTMKGELKTVSNSSGKPQFTLAMLGGTAVNSNADYRFEMFTNALLEDTNGTGGAANTKTHFSGSGYSKTSKHAVKFNSTHMNRGTDANDDNISDGDVCLSRNSFNTNNWQYNVYHRDAGTYNGKTVTAGQRVALNSGFPFVYNNSGTKVQGHIGYWGIWAENETAIPDNSTISKVDYSNGTTTDYTVKISKGKLIRRTKNTLNITKLVGQQLYYWGQNPDTSEWNQYVVTVDGSYRFVITHKVAWGESGPTQTDIADAILTGSTLLDANGETLWLWADGLGGNVVYTHNTVTAAADRTVKFYAEEVVNPGDNTIASGLNLKCYDRCLKGGVSTINGLPNDSTLFYPSDGTARSYTLSVSGGVMTMTDNTASAVVDFSGFSDTDMKAIQHGWGINTGSMVTTDVVIDPGSWWNIYDANVTYRWETGHQNWNKLVAVLDGSNTVQTFDKPIQFVYQLATADESNGVATHDGKTFMLQYGGQGQLWGFPWSQTGERWYPSVNLKNGVELTDGTNTFVVKATEREQSFKTDAGQCGTLGTSAVFSDTGLALPVASGVGTVSFNWSDKPTPTKEAPAFIGGEKQ